MMEEIEYNVFLCDYEFYMLWEEWKSHNIQFFEDVKKYCYPGISEIELLSNLLNEGMSKLKYMIMVEKYKEEKGIK